jgi:hypothetical protein
MRYGHAHRVPHARGLEDAARIRGERRNRHRVERAAHEAPGSAAAVLWAGRCEVRPTQCAVDGAVRRRRPDGRRRFDDPARRACWMHDGRRDPGGTSRALHRDVDVAMRLFGSLRLRGGPP